MAVTYAAARAARSSSGHGCPELFFEPRTMRSLAEARAFWHRCPVEVHCFATYAEGHTYGVWGGRTEEERASDVRAGVAT